MEQINKKESLELLGKIKFKTLEDIQNLMDLYLNNNKEPGDNKND